jgi:hypothetical protein
MRTAPAGTRAAGWLAVAAAAAAGAAGCSQSAAAVQPASGPSSAALPALPSTSAAGASHQPPARRRAAPARVILRRVRLPDGNLVTLAKFTGPVRFVLHAGYADPGLVPGLRAGPAVRHHERRMLLAAFNGGFKLSAGAGGYEQERRVLSPLRAGLASLVIYRSGRAAIGAWGRSVPRPGSPVYSVRQNQGLLVSGGRPAPAAAGWRAWGATLGGGEMVARSALGQDAAGQLIFAGSMAVSPADLAAALVRGGAWVGMQLDINPEWVQLAYARQAGGRLRAGLPGQIRRPSQYLTGWTRDFITVQAAGARTVRAGGTGVTVQQRKPQPAASMPLL